MKPETIKLMNSVLKLGASITRIETELESMTSNFENKDKELITIKEQYTQSLKDLVIALNNY